MSTPARKIVALTFIVTFLLVAPVVLLSAAGYRYNWKKNAVEKTGVLRLDSEPGDAAIVINGQTSRKRTPTLITALLPDVYAVRMEKDGYFSWGKTLEVKSGRTTFATEVVLFKETLPSLVFAVDALSARVSPDGKRAAYAALQAGSIEIGAAETGSSNVTLLARLSRNDLIDPEISWSPDGERVLLRAHHKNGRSVAIVYDAAGEKEPVSFDQSLPADIRTIQWSADGSSMLVSAANGLYRADAERGTLEPLKIGASIADAADIDGDVYAIRRQADKTTVTRRSQNVDIDIAVLPPGAFHFVDSASLPLLISDGTSMTFMVDRDGIELEMRSPTVSAAKGKGASDELLLMTSDFEISTWSADTDRNVVTRLGNAINGASWHPLGSYVIYATREAITAVELDERDSVNAYDLARASGILDFAVSDDGKKLYFFGEIGNQRGLFEREL